MAHRQRYHIGDFFRHVADSSLAVTCLTAVVCTLVCVLEIGAFVVCAGELHLQLSLTVLLQYHIYDWVAHAQD
jgi:hypothetical protein